MKILEVVNSHLNTFELTDIDYRIIYTLIELSNPELKTSIKIDDLSKKINRCRTQIKKSLSKLSSKKIIEKGLENKQEAQRIIPNVNNIYLNFPEQIQKQLIKYKKSESEDDDLGSFIENVVNSGYYGYRFAFSKQYINELCFRFCFTASLSRVDLIINDLLKNNKIQKKYIKLPDDEGYYLPKLEWYESYYITTISTIHENIYLYHREFLKSLNKKYSVGTIFQEDFDSMPKGFVAILQGNEIKHFEGKTLLSDIRTIDNQLSFDYAVIEDSLLLKSKSKSKSKLCLFNALIEKTSFGYIFQPLGVHA